MDNTLSSLYGLNDGYAKSENVAVFFLYTYWVYIIFTGKTYYFYVTLISSDRRYNWHIYTT